MTKDAATLEARIYELCALLEEAGVEVTTSMIKGDEDGAC